MRPQARDEPIVAGDEGWRENNTAEVREKTIASLSVTNQGCP